MHTNVNNTTVKLILIHDIPDSKVIPKNYNTRENSIIWQYCNNFNIVTKHYSGICSGVSINKPSVMHVTH